MWIGTTRAGLACLHAGEWQVFNASNSELPFNEVTALSLAPDGALWIGTGRAGLARLQAGQWEVFNTDNSELPSNYITALSSAPDGALWIGTWHRGLARLQAGEWQVFNTGNSGLLHDYILALSSAADGALWIGTARGGLARLDFDTGQWQAFNTANSELPNDGVQTLSFAPDGTLWIGTVGGGLAHFESIDTQPEILDWVGILETVHQREHTLAVRAFDPEYKTTGDQWRYEWKVHGKESLVRRGHSPFFSLVDLVDGPYVVEVVAIDRNGRRSLPETHEFVVDLPKPPSENPILDAVMYLLKYVALLIGLYALGLVPLIFLYSRSGLARTAINSGLFSRFPQIHKSILNSGWARKRIFSRFVESTLTSKDAELPPYYIDQRVYRVDEPELNPVPICQHDWKDALSIKPGSNAIFLGRSGTGKSVLMRYLLRAGLEQFLKKAHALLPVLIDLRPPPESGRSPKELILDRLWGGGVELPAHILQFMIRKGNFLVLIDSLNEVHDKTALHQFLDSFLSRNANNIVCLASQYDMLERRETLSLHLMEVTPEQARTHLRESIGEDVWDRMPEEAQAVACNPQDLSMIVEVVRALGPSEVPTHRADLYSELLYRDGTLGTWASNDTPEIRIIYALAYRLLNESKPLVPVDELGAWLRPLLDDHDRGGKDALVPITEALSGSRLFKQEDRAGSLGMKRAELGFRHELVGRFLAARHLRLSVMADSSEGLGEIIVLSDQHGWQDVFRFLIDELTTRSQLNRVLSECLKAGGELQLKLVAYALDSKPVGEINEEIFQAYMQARVKMDLVT